MEWFDINKLEIPEEFEHLKNDDTLFRSEENNEIIYEKESV
jgi:hypothetical protein